ncbi:MAG: MBL fold metallo-hydrolase [Bacteroidetes bacterium HGW-Bacteroidetes-8]|jgi:phosphoribosyl 1,2-cyclic phosphodiesterase|nr:MAG: MBL fold metallo-hydrolase [Bacteroidetes bacterium HGW-Bacteroidetes-8]
MLMSAKREESIKFISLSSGSSGNSYYIGNSEVAILIDAGISTKNIRKRLSEHFVNIESLDLVLLTHDHYDHIKHLTTLTLRYNKPVYGTEMLLHSLENHYHTKDKLSGYKKMLEKEIPFVYKGVSITAFDVPHDASDSLGYHIDFLGERFTLITDLGRVTKRVVEYCKISHNIIIESNYDRTMLEGGGYSKSLIDRIRGGRGHLSNDETSEAIKEFYHPGIKNIFLCHLSDNNNTPELAYETSLRSLSEIGVIVGTDVELFCLPRKEHKCYLV